VGLGNPGEEYTDTRHNTGRIILEAFAKKNDCTEWKADMKLKSLACTGKVGKEKVTLLMPETFMNNSGNAVRPLVTSAKKAETLVVIHDDLDLPIGRFKISFGKNSGGHRGVESIIKAVKTINFIRLRIGISKANAKGVVKKPQGEEAVGEYILAKFKKPELEELKNVAKRAGDALALIVTDGKETAMGEYNKA
jgi:PTH1 family peptidyl-tRNA hydrolase